MNKQGKDGIEYLDYTWNPISGCLHPCRKTYCYAAKIAKRFSGNVEAHKKLDEIWAEEFGEPKPTNIHVLDEKAMESGKVVPYPYGFEPTIHRYRLDEPQKVKKPSVIGVVFMGDMFGDWVPDSWVQEIFAACEKAPQHTYMFLTKNPKRYCSAGVSQMPKNFWFGATVTGYVDRKKAWDLLVNTNKYTNKFLSIEPLLDEFDLDEHELLLKNYRDIITIGNYLDWVIIGQQTNPNKPPPDEWVQLIIDQCRAAGVPVFVKSPLYSRFPIQERPGVA